MLFAITHTKADFDAPQEVNMITQDTLIQFQNTSGSAISYQWDFGDGTVSTLENPSHLYSAQGIYTVHLTVRGIQNCRDTITKELAIIRQSVIPNLPDQIEACWNEEVIIKPDNGTLFRFYDALPAETPFYEGDSLSFNYKKIGFVTAHGEQQIPDSLIINRLKYNSYLLCGNGVTEVVKSNILINNYTYKQFSANSVRIEKDSTYYNQYPPQNDFSFYHFSKNDITTSTEYTKFNPGLTLLSFAATITVVIIKALNPSDDNDEPDYEEEDYDYWDDEDDDGWE